MKFMFLPKVQKTKKQTPPQVFFKTQPTVIQLVGPIKSLNWCVVLKIVETLIFSFWNIFNKLIIDSTICEICFILGYLKDSKAVACSVDSNIFYAVIQLPGLSKTYINLY